MAGANRTKPSILLIGANGQVGNELQRALAPIGELMLASLEGEYGLQVDLGDQAGLGRLIIDTAPDAVVNAAAYTAVDKAESESDLAHQINAVAPGLLGRLLVERGVPIIHYSTDYVFAGDSDRPYREDDQPGPLNVYGETKLGGERALMASGAAAIIFRTSWVYGTRGKNFLLTMLRLMAEQDELRIVDDQIGAPTWARMLAEITAQVLHRILHGTLDAQALRGVYHATAAGQTSWYNFAAAIKEASRLNCNLLPISTADYRSSTVERPAYSVLDNTLLKETFGLALPDWRFSLRQCLEDIGRLKR